MTSMEPRNVGQGPQVLPLRHFALTVNLDGSFGGVKALDGVGDAGWVEAGAAFDQTMEVRQPDLDQPHFTFTVTAVTADAACEMVVQALQMMLA